MTQAEYDSRLASLGRRVRTLVSEALEAASEVRKLVKERTGDEWPQIAALLGCIRAHYVEMRDLAEKEGEPHVAERIAKILPLLDEFARKLESEDIAV